MTRAKLSSTAVLLAVLVPAALTGCSADGASSGDGTAAPSPAGASSAPGEGGADDDDGVTLIKPGAPGEPAQTGGDAAPVEPEPWNHDDIAFVQMMVPHHAQALEMARLARTRAGSDEVRRFAARVDAAQRPEILLMAAWLEEQRVEVPGAGDDPTAYDHGAHGHDGMEGMLTPTEMDRLAAARGRAFDRLFLEGMIRHHEGAVTMAGEVAADGTALQVSELAADVSAGQSAEIGRMRDLLAAL